MEALQERKHGSRAESIHEIFTSPEVLSALAHKNRIKILMYVNNKGPLSFTELVKMTGQDGPALAHHLEKLLREGLITKMNNPDPYDAKYRLYHITSLGADVLTRLGDVKPSRSR